MCNEEDHNHELEEADNDIKVLRCEILLNLHHEVLQLQHSEQSKDPQEAHHSNEFKQLRCS